MAALGIRVYGLGAIALGLVGIIWGNFALQWQPVAPWFPARTLLAYLFAAALLVAGVITQQRPKTGVAALIALYGAVVVLMHGPAVIQNPDAFYVWNGAAEQLALVAGGLAVRFGRVAVKIMGVCLVTFGIAHFVYLDFTASMVPAWLPGGQRFWAAATGVGHLAAGLAFLTGIQIRLAAIAVTAMFGSFSLLVHLPLLVSNPNAHMSWVINAINLALTGAAWAFVTCLTHAAKAPAAESPQRVLQ